MGEEVKKRIILNNIADVTAFVLAASEIDGDITAYNGRIAIDGKSF